MPSLLTAWFTAVRGDFGAGAAAGSFAVRGPRVSDAATSFPPANSRSPRPRLYRVPSRSHSTLTRCPRYGTPSSAKYGHSGGASGRTSSVSSSRERMPASPVMTRSVNDEWK